MLRKLAVLVVGWVVICGGGVALAGDLRCTDYNKNYADALESGIAWASISGEPLNVHGFCRISRPITYESKGVYDFLTIAGDGEASSILFFDFFDGNALTISGWERRLPFRMRDIAIKRVNDGVGRGFKNVLLRRITDFSIDGVAIYGSNGFSLAIQDSQLGRITNSTVGVTSGESGADGIHLEAPGSDMLVSNNTLYMTGDDAISVGSHINNAVIENVLIANNTVWESARSGIKVHEGARDVTVSNNIVRNTRLSCYATTTEGYSNNAIKNILFTGNVAHHCGEAAFRVNGDGAQISDVAVKSSTAHDYKKGFMWVSGWTSNIKESGNEK